MPTSPSGQQPQAHQHRAVAESFGTDAARYDRTRPPYPDDLVAAVLAAGPGLDVLDVGCGTGIAARQFQAAGCTVLGVDPDARMAEFARQAGTEVEVATFETWEPAGRRFDVVAAGQSWHWVDPLTGPAKAAEVLRPGGVLAVFAHVFQPPAEVGRAFAAAFQRMVPDSPFRFGEQPARQPKDIYQAGFVKFGDDIRAAGEFAEPEQRRFDWEKSYTRDEWLDLVPTQGPMTRLPADQLSVVLAEVGAAIDALGGGFTMSYTTLLVTAVLGA